jgi:hypothetical protein
VPFIVCVVLSERGMLFCVICVVLYLIVVPLPPGKNQFAVKLSNNNKKNSFILDAYCPSNQQEMHSLVVLLFGPEDGGSAFFRNIGELIPD